MTAQTIVDVERVADELARLRIELEQAVGRLADAELQRDDARSERDQQVQQLAEALHAALINSAALEKSLHAALQKNVVIEQAVGVLTEKAHVDAPRARSLLKRYSRDHREEMCAVAARIIAGQDPASSNRGDSEVERIITNVGIPLEFWNALTLNGEIFK